MIRVPCDIDRGFQQSSDHNPLMLRFAEVTTLGLLSFAALASEPVSCGNVESDGNDPAVIVAQLVELGPYDVFALSDGSRNRKAI